MNPEMPELTRPVYADPLEVASRVDRNFKRVFVIRESHAITENYTFSVTDEIEVLLVDATASAITITLPSPTGNRPRRVVKTDASTNAVTVSGGANLINGVASHVITTRYGNITVVPTGTSWLIVGWNSNGPLVIQRSNNSTKTLTLSLEGGNFDYLGVGTGYSHIFSVDGTEYARINASGLTVTGGATITGLAGVGTRNVVVDASGNLSAP